MLPGRDEYRVVSGGNSERVFVALALIFALLFYPVSRVGFDGLIYRMGGDDQLYGTVTQVTDGDTIDVETQGRTTPVRLIGVDTPETVDPEQPMGCYGPEASEYTKQILYERQTDNEGRVLREGRLVRLEIPRIGDSEDAYGRTLAYVYLDTDGDGRYEHSFNEDLIELGLARTTDFSHEHRREFERLREQAEERGRGCGAPAPSWKATEESVTVTRPCVAGQWPLRLVLGRQDSVWRLAYAHHRSAPAFHGFFTASSQREVMLIYGERRLCRENSSREETIDES